MPTRVHLREVDHTGVAEISAGSVVLAGTPGVFEVRRESDGRFAVSHDGRTFSGSAALQGETVWVFVEGSTFEIHTAAARRDTAAGAGLLSPPMPATVVRVAVSPGQTVAPGDLLVALEAMKMELPIRATVGGRVRAVHCREGELVQPGTRLLEIE